jgi:hypothetical protein
VFMCSIQLCPRYVADIIYDVHTFVAKQVADEIYDG